MTIQNLNTNVTITLAERHDPSDEPPAEPPDSLIHLLDQAPPEDDSDGVLQPEDFDGDSPTGPEGVEGIEFNLLDALRGFTPKEIPESGDETRALEDGEDLADEGDEVDDAQDDEPTVAEIDEESRLAAEKKLARDAAARARTDRMVTTARTTGVITTSSITVSAVPVEPEKDWHDRANCLGVDPDLFFPERGSSTREAKEVCRGCEARQDCLEFALQNGEKFGIWGGLSERERRRIRRQRSQVARSILGA